MRIRIDEKLTKAVSEAAKFAATSGQAEICKALLLNAANGTVKVTAYNMGAFYSEVVEMDVEEPGAIAVAAPILKEIVQRYYGVLSVQGNTVTVSDKNGSFETIGLEPDGFPVAPKLTEIAAGHDSAAPVELKGDMLLKALKTVAYAAARTESACVKVFSRDGVFYADTLDGYQAARVELPLPEGTAAAEIQPICIPLSIVNQLLGDKRFGTKDSVYILKSAKNIVFQAGGVQIVSPAIMKPILDLDGIIKFNRMEISFSSDRLREMLGKLTLVTAQSGYKESARPLVMQFDAATGKVVFSLKCATASFRENVECSPSAFAYNMRMGFNPTFLEAALKVIDVDTLKWNIGKAVSPVFLLPENSDGSKSIHVILPVRLAGEQND